DGVLTIDHRIRCRPLLTEVDDRLGCELPHGPVQEVGVHQVADIHGDLFTRDLLPRRDADLQVLDRDQALRAELLVVSSAGEIVEDGDFMAAIRKVEGRRPPQVSVTTENEDSHGSPASRSSSLRTPERLRHRMCSPSLTRLPCTTRARRATCVRRPRLRVVRPTPGRRSVHNEKVRTATPAAAEPPMLPVRRPRLLIRLFRAATSSVLATAISQVTLIGLLWWGAIPALASAVAFVAGAIPNFFLSRRWAWGRR